MNRSELVAAIADSTDLSQKDVDAVLKSFAEVVGENIAKGEKVAITGFLSFESTFRNARTARNPRTGEEIAVAATYAAKVSAGSGLKQAAASRKK